MRDFDTFFAGVLEALYWTETGDEGRPSSDAELLDGSLDHLRADALSFWYRFRPYINTEPSDPGMAQAGHDFWLTRNGHGAGFWDGDWPVYGDMLTKGAEGYGEFYPEFDEDAELEAA